MTTAIIEKDDIARDLLFGASAVAQAIGLSRRQVYHAAENGHMPLFKIGTTICARRSTLVRWFAERETSSFLLMSNVLTNTIVTELQ